MSPSAVARRSSDSTMASRFSAQMSGQMPGEPAAMRVMSRKPPAASRRRAACSAAPSVASAMRVAAVRWGTWDTMATTWSWRSGGRATTSAPSDDTSDRTRANASGSVSTVGREHPRRPLEQLGVGPVDPVLLGAGHGVPAHEPGVADRGDDGALHAADVGDHAGSAGQGGPGLGGDGEHRRAHERDVGPGIVADGVERPQLERPRRPVAVEVASGHVPAPGPQRQPDRAPDQPRPHDDGPGRPVGRGGQTGRSSFSPTAPSR